MRRLLRLALPLGLLAALAVPTSALAQVTVSTNSSGGLALLASSPTGRDTTAFTGNTTLNSSWITNLSGADARVASFGDGISGPGIPGGSATISTAVRSGGTVAGNTIAAANATPPGATESGNTVTINMTTPHNFQVGDSIVVAGVAVGGYNGTFTVTDVPTITSFTYTNPTVGLGNSGGGTATGPNPGLSEVGNTVLVRLGAFDHNLVVGHTVTITGAGNALYNGTWTVTGTPSGSSFTFTHPTSGIASAWGGTVTPFATFVTTAPHGLSVGSTVTIDGVGIAGYNGTFTVLTVPLPTVFTTSSVAQLLPSGAGTASTQTTVTGVGTPANALIDPVGLDNSILWETKALPADAGDGTSITYNDPGGFAATLGASVAGDDITINLGRAFVGANASNTIAASPGGATETGNTVTITTTAAHNLHVGQTVTIAGVAEAGYNGTFEVLTTPSTTTFTYTNPTAGLAASGGGTVQGSGIQAVSAPGAGGTITAASHAVSTVTITTIAAHNLKVGQAVTISGLSVAGYNGTFQVASVPSATTFTYTTLAGLIPFAPLNGSFSIAASPGGATQSVPVAASPNGALQTFAIAASPTGATETGNTVTITTTGNHHFLVGESVTIAGVTDAGYNGTFTIDSVPNSTSFTYTNPTAGLAASGGGTVTSGKVTITTTAPHNLIAGNNAILAGIGVAGFNGTFLITSVPSPTTFTYTNPTTGLANSGGGIAGGNTLVTLTTTAAHTFTPGDSITVSGVGVAGYNGTFTVSTVPSSTTLTYNAAASGLANSGGGTVAESVGGTATGLSGASEVGNTVTIQTRAAHGLQVGQSVTLDGVLVGGYNGTWTVTGVPTTTSFTYENPTAGLAASGGGQVYTVTTTAAALITAANGGAGDFAAVAALVTATASGTTTGRLAGVGNTPFTNGENDTIQLSQPASATASGVNFELSSARRNGDMAFWGDTLVQGSDRGFRLYDISNPASPALESDFSCNGASGDVSVWENLVFRSVDVPQTTAACAGSADQYWKTTGGNHTATAQSTRITPGFEGIRIVDISNPSAPSFVAGVATDCGSFTHTLVPDVANDRVLLYVSSFPNAAIDATPTTFGNTCELLAPGSPAAPNQISGHDKLTIVEVPLDNPSAAHVLDEITLGLKGYNSFFAHIPGYTGDFNNQPGYKGCHDIAVSMATHTAAAACVTEGVTLDISDPEAPTVEDHFVNPDIDLCATGVFRWAGGTSSQAATPNCMWGTAMFTYDGKRIIWGSSTSGHAGCGSNSATVALSCNPRGNTNASVDRLYDGQSLSNECETGAGTAPVRSPFNRAAFWMNDAADASWPISQTKIPYSLDASVNRYELYSGQGCSASLGNVVPVNGKYILPLSWHIGGMNVVDWTNHLSPTELGWFDVNTSFAESTANANPLNRPAGNSALKSNAAAAYWYNGYIYVSNEAPAYGSWYPAGSRGLEVFQLTNDSVSGAFDLPHLNPQTQESLLTCAITISGSPKVGVKRTIKATVKVMGQGVKGAVVKAKTHSFNASKTTPANGQVSVSFKPNKKAKTLTFSVAAQTNMLGCSKSKNVAK